MRFYLTFSLLGFKVINKGKMNLFKGSEDFEFSNFIYLDCKSDSSSDNSYCVRSVIVLLVVNVGRLELLASEDNFFCLIFKDFYNHFHNILILFDALPNFPFTTSEPMGDYYL